MLFHTGKLSQNATGPAFADGRFAVNTPHGVQLWRDQNTQLHGNQYDQRPSY